MSRAIRDVKRNRKADGGYRIPDPRTSYGDGGIHTTPNLAMRAIRTMDALFKALGERGYGAQRRDDRFLFRVLGETFSVRIEEPSKQVPHVPKKDDWYPR